MENELRPCPFCGHSAMIVATENFNSVRFFVACNICGVETPRISRTQSEAISAWNRRPSNE